MNGLAVALPLFDEVGDEPTLDDRVVGAWEGLIAHRTVQCIVCHGEMRPVDSPDGTPTEGRCAACGSTLA